MIEASTSLTASNNMNTSSGICADKWPQHKNQSFSPDVTTICIRVFSVISWYRIRSAGYRICLPSWTFSCEPEKRPGKPNWFRLFARLAWNRFHIVYYSYRKAANIIIRECICGSCCWKLGVKKMWESVIVPNHQKCWFLQHFISRYFFMFSFILMLITSPIILKKRKYLITEYYNPPKLLTRMIKHRLSCRWRRT